MISAGINQSGVGCSVAEALVGGKFCEDAIVGRGLRHNETCSVVL